jgi:hypothetical protein
MVVVGLDLPCWGGGFNAGAPLVGLLGGMELPQNPAPGSGIF